MTTTTLPEVESRQVESRVATGQSAFERWGAGLYLVGVAALVAGILAYLGGSLVYVLDDPAIHLSMADTLIHHGTWGVQAGAFESASSSPLWTLLVAGGIAVAPTGDQWVPLLLNVLAGLGVVAILGRAQTAVVPGRRRPFDALVTGVVVVVALFLPGLAVVGMEHTLHVALVLAAVVVVQANVSDPIHDGRLRPWLPYLLIVLATLTRFETAFVAVGLAAGVACDAGPVDTDSASGAGASRRNLYRSWMQLRARGRQMALILASSAVPLAAFGLWNRAMGGGWLPNSVLSKGQGLGTANAESDGLGPVDVVVRLERDPLLVAMFALAVGYLFVNWRRPGARFRVVAMTFAVATLLHATLADFGWFERYQAYLIGVGVYLVLGIITELPLELRRRALGALVIVILVLGLPKAGLLVRVHRGADDMYRQQVQAARFMERYYDGEAIATDQLGYISLYHDGPLTDLAGLGDYEVLQDRPAKPGEIGPYWKRLAEERGFRVVAVYDTSGWGVPRGWILVGELVLTSKHLTGISDRMQFWATTPDEVAPLHDHLAEFSSELPDRVSMRLNDWAGLQATKILEEGSE